MIKLKTKTQKTVVSALFAALVCVATMVIKVPSPLEGYVNLGDGFVLISAWILPPAYGLLAAGIGSGLADLLSGYVAYAPATFVIKALMAFVAYVSFKIFSKGLKSPRADGEDGAKRIEPRMIFIRMLSAALAEAVMILGYFLFEGFMYGFAASLVNIPANAVQAVAGTVIGVSLITVFERQNITGMLK